MNARSMTRSALFAALLCILAPVSIPLGTVPVTFATFAVLLAGAVLDRRQAVAAVFIYLLAGAVGLPVFSGGRGGLAVLVGPTAGYLWAYPLMVWIVAAAPEGIKHGRSACCVLAMLVCYLFGCAWFMVATQTGLIQALTVCVLPFLPMDIVKAVVAAHLGKLLQRRLNQTD